MFKEIFDNDGDGIITKEEFRTRIGHMAWMTMQLGRLDMLGCATIHGELNEVEADSGHSTIDFVRFHSIMTKKLTSPPPREMTSPAATDVDM